MANRDFVLSRRYWRSIFAMAKVNGRFEKATLRRGSGVERPEWADYVVHPPSWFLPGPFVCGGAQRGGSLAEGGFAGDSTSNPPGGIQAGKAQYINQLRNHDLSALDSFAKSSKSSLPNPLGEIHPTKSSQTEVSGRADMPVLDPRFSSSGTGS